MVINGFWSNDYSLCWGISKSNVKVIYRGIVGIKKRWFDKDIVHKCLVIGISKLS